MPAILQVAAPTPRGSPPIPTWSGLSPVTCTNGLPTASAVTQRPCLFRLVPCGPASSGGKVEGRPGCHLIKEFHAYFLPAFISPTGVPIERRGGDKSLQQWTVGAGCC